MMRQRETKLTNSVRAMTNEGSFSCLTSPGEREHEAKNNGPRTYQLSFGLSMIHDSLSTSPTLIQITMIANNHNNWRPKSQGPRSSSFKPCDGGELLTCICITLVSLYHITHTSFSMTSHPPVQSLHRRYSFSFAPVT